MPFVAHRAFGWVPVEITPDWGLNTVPTGKAYTICASLQCQDCGHLFLDMRFADDQMEALYRDYYGEDYARLRETYEPGYYQKNETFKVPVNYTGQIESLLRPYFPSPPRILDWGGGRGLNTPFRRWNAGHHLLDISERAPVEGAVYVQRDQLIPGAYDLVVCANVLEHIPYPEDLLAELKTCLRPDTLIYLELPYETILRTSNDDRSAYLRKKHWHEHINFFTPASLRALLSRAGIEIVEIQAVNVAPPEAPSFNFMAVCRLAA
jgi:SAM-dependent methyltransferase